MKFQVGDKVELIRAVHSVNLGKIGFITGVHIFATQRVGEPCYFTDMDGPGVFCRESRLRKLPPDDKQDYLAPETRKLFDGHKVKNPDRKPVSV
jgi:hypothetical protein